MPESGWRLEQVYSHDGDGNERLPIEEAFAANRAEAQSGLSKLGILRLLGWPEARVSMRDSRGRPRIEKVDDDPPPIYVLKCKPSCWRIYFHVAEETQEKGEHSVTKTTPQARRSGAFLLLYVVCKKQSKRDSEDIAHARRPLQLWQRGHVRSKAFLLPTR